MKLIARQKFWLTFVLVVNAALWIVPSNVAEQVARDRHTMLGRYSRTHFTWCLAVLGLTLVSLYIDRATGPAYKRRWFQVIAFSMVLIPALVLFDFAARGRQRVYYVKESLAYHRVPNDRIEDHYVDRPLAARTYPNAPPGHAHIDGTLCTDARGYRNPTAWTEADVVVLGDSFAEGSGVSDEHTWPALLSQRSGRRVYNLGMSGYDPLNYLAALKEHGLALRPKTVLCMLYEGNDFRSAKSDDERASPGWAERFSVYWKQSPLISALDELLIRTFGSLRSSAPFAGSESVEWLPLGVPSGPPAKHYAFAPKQLADLYRPSQEFAANKKWQNTQRILEQIHTACEQVQARLTIVYAPTKAHVILPLVADRLSASNVRAFLALDENEESLPPAPELLANLLQHADGRESVVADWCRSASVGFISLTSALRQACAEGKQVYFTYDQHWTPSGHEVVAEWLLANRGLPSVRSRPAVKRSNSWVRADENPLFNARWFRAMGLTSLAWLDASGVLISNALHGPAMAGGNGQGVLCGHRTTARGRRNLL